MAAERARPLARSTVIKLASVLSLADNAFFVGGQALNLWAERYAPSRAELISFGPFTSKDLDYLAIGPLQKSSPRRWTARFIFPARTIIPRTRRS